MRQNSTKIYYETCKQYTLYHNKTISLSHLVIFFQHSHDVISGIGCTTTVAGRAAAKSAAAGGRRLGRIGTAARAVSAISSIATALSAAAGALGSSLFGIQRCPLQNVDNVSIVSQRIDMPKNAHVPAS